MAKTLKEKLSVKEIWFRLIFMIIYALLVYWVAFTIILIIALFQFIYSLFVGKPNQTLLPFGISLSKYIHQIMEYLTYASNEKPFPFKAWPSTKEEKVAEPKKITAKKTTAKKA